MVPIDPSDAILPLEESPSDALVLSVPPKPIGSPTGGGSARLMASFARDRRMRSAYLTLFSARPLWWSWCQWPKRDCRQASRQEVAVRPRSQPVGPTQVPNDARPQQRTGKASI